MADDVKVLPDTNEARTADPEVPDFGTNYVETGLHLLADFDAGLLSVSAGAALHSFDGDLYYATNINRRTGERRLSIPGGTTGVYYDFEARSLVMGDPGEPALQIGSVDASGETVDETINRTRDVAIGDAEVETVSGGDGDFDSVNTEYSDTDNVVARVALGTDQTITGSSETQIKLDNQRTNQITEEVTVDTVNNKIIIDESGNYRLSGVARVAPQDTTTGAIFTNANVNGAVEAQNRKDDISNRRSFLIPNYTDSFDVGDEITMTAQFFDAAGTDDNQVDSGNNTTYLEVLSL